MLYHHVIIWIDHHAARVFSINRHESQHEWEMAAPSSPEHLHHKAGPVAGSGKAKQSGKLFAALTSVIKHAGEILVTGPGLAKQEFVKHLEDHAPDIRAKVVAVEPLDHPSDGELIRFAQKRFHALDRLH